MCGMGKPGDDDGFLKSVQVIVGLLAGKCAERSQVIEQDRKQRRHQLLGNAHKLYQP